MEKASRLLLAAVLAASVAGCGFQLRSWDLGTSIQSAYVVSNPRNPLQEPLRRALGQAGVTLVTSGADADVTVELLEDRSNRRSVTVSGQGRAAEYEMILGVRYRVADRSGRELVAPQWLERERVFRVDRENIVGSSEEQALLEREMRSDLIQQIIRTLNAVVPAASETAAEPPPPAESSGPSATPEAAAPEPAATPGPVDIPERTEPPAAAHAD